MKRSLFAFILANCLYRPCLQAADTLKGIYDCRPLTGTWQKDKRLGESAQSARFECKQIGDRPIGARILACAHSTEPAELKLTLGNESRQGLAAVFYDETGEAVGLHDKDGFFLCDSKPLRPFLMRRDILNCEFSERSNITCRDKKNGIRHLKCSEKKTVVSYVQSDSSKAQNYCVLVTGSSGRVAGMVCKRFDPKTKLLSPDEYSQCYQVRLGRKIHPIGL
ncbi:MAG: hypothetical protein HY921_04540 [Elusimicrobia bacterium]|nr:hypothetical protein [Elusimicrobiota bacterium]